MLLALVLILGLASVPNEVFAQARRSSSHVAGCYQLTLGEWSRPLDNVPTIIPPQQLQLDTAVLPHLLPRDTLWSVRPSMIPSRGRLPTSSWRYVGSDSVAIVWSTGFTGVQLRLGIFGDTLRGEAIAFDDKQIQGEPPDPRATVQGRRTQCLR
jgi:hypothetical protein